MIFVGTRLRYRPSKYLNYRWYAPQSQVFQCSRTFGSERISKMLFFIRILNYTKLTNPAFIKKLNLLLYYTCWAIKLTKGEYDLLSLSLFRSYRFAGYKQFSWWIHNRLGKWVRKVIPSCALWNIRQKYPSADGSYIPFNESRDDEARELYGDN